MPPASDAELQEAEQHLRSSGIKKRVTQPAIVTEVARRRILRGDYGYQPTRITQAAVDLCLSERQKQELRQQLRDEVMPVRTLDSMFMAAATAQPAEPTVEVQFEEQLAARREMHTWLYFEEQVAEWHFRDGGTGGFHWEHWGERDVVNTDCASQGATHWFVVAWLIE